MPNTHPITLKERKKNSNQGGQSGKKRKRTNHTIGSKLAIDSCPKHWQKKEWHKEKLGLLAQRGGGDQKGRAKKAFLFKTEIKASSGGVYLSFYSRERRREGRVVQKKL